MSAEFVVLFVAYGSSQHNKFFSNTLSSYFLRKVLPIIDLSTIIFLFFSNLLLTFSASSAIMDNVAGQDTRKQRKNMREWRNWQTRTFEGRVVHPYGFKSRFSHHEKATEYQ